MQIVHMRVRIFCTTVIHKTAQNRSNLQTIITAQMLFIGGEGKVAVGAESRSFCGFFCVVAVKRCGRYCLEV